MGIETVLALGSLIMGGVGTVSKISEANDAKKKARKQEQLQQEQLESQRKQSELQDQIAQRKATRQARVSRARMVSQTGGMIGGSVVESPLVAADSALGGALDLMGQQQDLREDQMDIQGQQIGVQGDIAQDNANAAIWGSVTGGIGNAVNASQIIYNNLSFDDGEE